jgi:hypothetical protein
MTKPTARVASVKTPGVGSTPEDTEREGDALVDAAPGLDSGPEAKEQMLTMTAAQLDAAIKRGVRDEMNARAKAAAPIMTADLPDQSEIDPATIKRPTLSKQGFVVPLNYGEPADPSIKR